MSKNNRRESTLIDLYSNILDYIRDHYPQEYKHSLDKLGYSSNDLKQLPRNHFMQPNTPSDHHIIMFEHYEKRRQAKIAQVANEVYQLSSNDKLIYNTLTTLGIKLNKVKRKLSLQESSITLSKLSETLPSPHECKFNSDISAGFQRSEEKINREAKVIAQLQRLRKLDSKKNEIKEQQRQKKLEKIDEYLQTVQQEIAEKYEKLEEKRRLALSKKGELQNQDMKKRLNHEKEIKMKLKQIDKLKREKDIQSSMLQIRDKEIRREAEEKRQKESQQSKLQNERRVTSSLEKLESRFKLSTRSLENNITGKIQQMRQHSNNVQRKLYLTKEQEQQLKQQALQKVVQKYKQIGQNTNFKKQIEQDAAKSISERLSKSFERQRVCLTENENERMSRIKQEIQKKKEKVDQVMQNKIATQRVTMQKALKNDLRRKDQQENYRRELENQRKLREKILAEHQQKAQYIQQLQNTRQKLAQNKLQQNLEISHIRASKLASPIRSRGPFTRSTNMSKMGLTMQDNQNVIRQSLVSIDNLTNITRRHCRGGQKIRGAF